LHDNIIVRKRVAEKYPRIYNNSNLKTTTLAKMGKWNNKCWEWKFQ